MSDKPLTWKAKGRATEVRALGNGLHQLTIVCRCIETPILMWGRDATITMVAEPEANYKQKAFGEESEVAE